MIEVGVDIPNATVMVRTRRASAGQLHQLRGRVGEGPSDGDPDGGREPDRVGAPPPCLRKPPGFRAEEDLAIRGPGDFLGTRQSGIPPFRVADIIRDAEFLRLARKEASDFLASPAAETSEGRRILEHVRETWGERFGLTAGG